jgi:hypothetical protein
MQTLTVIDSHGRASTHRVPSREAAVVAHERHFQYPVGLQYSFEVSSTDMAPCKNPRCHLFDRESLEAIQFDSP